MKLFQKIVASIMLVAFAVSLTSAAPVPTKKKKITPQALYITAKEAYEMVKTDPTKLVFIDVRTPDELYFVGVPEGIDKNIPLAYVNYTKIKEI